MVKPRIRTVMKVMASMKVCPYYELVNDIHADMILVVIYPVSISPLEIRISPYPSLDRLTSNRMAISLMMYVYNSFAWS